MAALLAASKSEVPAPHGSVSMIARSTWLDQVRDVLHGLACASVLLFARDSVCSGVFTLSDVEHRLAVITGPQKRVRLRSD